MQRSEHLRRLAHEHFDLVVVGGGATGLGIAVDAATRGHSVALLERGDFAKGTSSRSSKLVHGGVRYLAQGNIALVKEALQERAILLRNAGHLARPLPFVMPAYNGWHTAFYGTGLKLYDMLSGKAGLADTQWISRERVAELVPTIRRQGLRNGVKYWDGQFDDARLAIALARTAQANGAALLNYCDATSVDTTGGRARGVHAQDQESGERFLVRARCVVNATGVWVDGLRRTVDGSRQPDMVVPSQGVHLALDRSFLPTDHAVFWPRTSDGRVLFALPWLGKTIVGTTDTQRPDAPVEPRPLQGEVEFILAECARFLQRAPSPSDVLSAWVGLRPLVNKAPGTDTKGISREHTVAIDASGLVSVTGGKWTTYRSMAEDVLDRCESAALLEARGPCATRDLPLAGACDPAGGAPGLADPQGLHSYGADAAEVAALDGHDRPIAGSLTQGMVRFAARREFARTVEDVLARRHRLLFLDAALAASAAPEAARILAEETGRDAGLQAFLALAGSYRLGQAAAAP